MKTIISMLLVALFSINASALDYDPLDRFPWDWGTECPFPWSEIDGEYVVKSMSGDKKLDGTMIHLVSIEPETNKNKPVLKLTHYNRYNRLLASGVGLADKENKIIEVDTISPVDVKTMSKIFIRTYVAEVTEPAAKEDTLAASCQKKTQVVTATFCPKYGRKCKVTENYILEKVID